MVQLQNIFKVAVERGYKYDPESGAVLGLLGRPLKMTLTGSQRYPTFALSVPGIGKGTFAVCCHRLAGYCIWGDEIFKPGVQVRHINGIWDIRKKSLCLGTRIENMADISPEVRSKAAQAGRAAQSKHPANAGMSEDTVRFIRKTAQRNSAGQLLPGELERIAKRHGRTKQYISNLLRGITFSSVK